MSAPTYSVKLEADSLNRTLLALNKVDVKVGRDAVKKGVKRGTKTALGIAKNNAPVGKTRLFLRGMASVVRSYTKDRTYVGLIGTRFDKRFGAKTASVARRRNYGLSTGISGTGRVTPIHLVDQPVKPHAMPGKKGARLKPYAMIPATVATRRGTARKGGKKDIRYFRKANHPGHSGRKFMERSAQQAVAPSNADIRAELQAALNGLRVSS